MLVNANELFVIMILLAWYEVFPIFLWTHDVVSKPDVYGDEKVHFAVARSNRVELQQVLVALKCLSTYLHHTFLMTVLTCLAEIFYHVETFFPLKMITLSSRSLLDRFVKQMSVSDS